MLRRLLSLWPDLRDHRRQLSAGVAAIFVSVVLALVAPLLIGRAVDELRAEPAASTLLAYAGLLLLVVAGQGGFGYLQRTLLGRMSHDIELRLRNRYFEALARLPPRFLQERATPATCWRGRAATCSPSAC